MKRAGIYLIRNIRNGRVYVGSSVNVSKRLYVHRWRLERGDHDSRMLQRAWEKYGSEAFVFELVEAVVELDLLLLREQDWIDRYRAADGVHGYNACPTAGTRRGVPQPASVAIKLRAVHTGKPKSAEQRAKMSAAAKGRPKSAEHRAAIAAAVRKTMEDPERRALQSKNQTGKPNAMRGKKHSPESLESFRQAATLRARGANGKFRLH